MEWMGNTGSPLMYTNTAEILNDGVDWLRKKFGDVETELFISLIIREKFDYTKWRRQFFGDESVKEINDAASAYARENPFLPKRQQVPIERNG